MIELAKPHNYNYDDAITRCLITTSDFKAYSNELVEAVRAKHPKADPKTIRKYLTILVNRKILKEVKRDRYPKFVNTKYYSISEEKLLYSSKLTEGIRHIRVEKRDPLRWVSFSCCVWDPSISNSNMKGVRTEKRLMVKFLVTPSGEQIDPENILKKSQRTRWRLVRSKNMILLEWVQLFLLLLRISSWYPGVALRLSQLLPVHC